MKYCPQCGFSQIRDDATYCPECGGNVSMQTPCDYPQGEYGGEYCNLASSRRQGKMEKSTMAKVALIGVGFVVIVIACICLLCLT